ncbi:MAG: DUF6298 domain-containing protein [bacterium]
MAQSAVAAPIALHPENPHYFLFHDRPTVLITGGEHYGAVMNLDFDYVRYLDELERHGFNLTRTFSGTYREVDGSFHITGNTLNPAPGRYVCPWARSTKEGAVDGGNKFDLTQWDSQYFERLKDFIHQADQRGIVVELVFFCTMYREEMWNASPMNPRNNISQIGILRPYEIYSGKDRTLLESQSEVVRKLVTELNEFENLYYEICNEPYERAGLSREWNELMVTTVLETEKSLPLKHLIAQNVAFQKAQIKGLNPAVSVLNFHAATPECVEFNYPLNRVIAFDETGGADRSDRKYRTEGWEFMLSGGGVYSHLDFSFTPDHEDGTAVPLPSGTPGGGGPELRRQLSIMKKFIESFDFIKLTPRNDIMRDVRAVESGRGARSENKPAARAMAEVGRAYAIYIKGGNQTEIVLEIPEGEYSVEWVNTKTGEIDKSEAFSHSGGDKPLVSPVYQEDIALRIKTKASQS